MMGVALFALYALGVFGFATKFKETIELYDQIDGTLHSDKVLASTVIGFFWPIFCLVLLGKNAISFIKTDIEQTEEDMEEYADRVGQREE